MIVDREKEQHLRPVLVAPVEDKKWVRLAKEILLIELVGTELHGGNVLENNRLSVTQSENSLIPTTSCTAVRAASTM